MRTPANPPAAPPKGFSVDTKNTVEGSSVSVPAVKNGGNLFADPNRAAEPGPKTSAPPAAPPSEPPRFEAPRLVTHELERTPPYPGEARRYEIEGVVMLRVCIGTDGTVATVEVLKGLGFGCDESASNWVKHHWRYEPARRGGAVVPYCMPQPIRFQLRP